jgi:pilus assembly protein CpaF
MIHLLVNAKGGSGATTLSVELARASLKAKRNAAVVDADLTGRRCLAATLHCMREFNEHRSVYVYAIARVQNMTAVELADTMDNAFSLRMDQNAKLTTSLIDDNDVVYVDCNTPFAESLRPFVMRAARILIVTEPTFIGCNAARALMRDLASYGVPPNRLGLIVNARSKAEIMTHELAKMLLPVIGDIPRREDRNYARAVADLEKALAAIPDEDPIQLNASIRVSSDESTRMPSTGIAKNVDHSNVATGESGAAPAARNGSSMNGSHDSAPAPRRDDARTKLKAEIAEIVSRSVDTVAASRVDSEGTKVSKLRDEIREKIAAALRERHENMSAQEVAELQQEIMDELLGLGPLEDLMRDEKITEIMVNGPNSIYVERAGKLTLSDRAFRDERHLRTIIERIVAPLGRRVDESSPMVDARLPDGSRVNAIIPPLALRGSTVTIRRFSKRKLTVDDLITYGSIHPDSAALLRAMVEARLNIVVSGGTGSGKTTFLNILSNFIPENERIVTIEDAAELSLVQEHVVPLESRPPNLEGKGSIAIRDLVKNSLRMRPDRIVIGECRGGEALDMLQAMNTGHDGSLTTLHANTPRDAIARLETLVLMAGYDLPVRAIREQIAGAVDVIVQIERMRDGSRKCTHVTEVVGMEGDRVTMQDLITYEMRGVDENDKVIGDFMYSGVQPQAVKNFRERGIDFDVRSLSRLKTTQVTTW